jgi:hypothetical protein
MSYTFGLYDCIYNDFIVIFIVIINDIKHPFLRVFRSYMISEKKG